MQDHLAGARFAVTLLDDLIAQKADADAADLAARLLTEIKQDRSVLEEFVNQFGADRSLVKEASAWIAQKASKAKLDVSEPFGIFEAVELLSLGVLGKRALWNTLNELKRSGSFKCEPELEELIRLAEQQYEGLEKLRRTLARRVFD